MQSSSPSQGSSSRRWSDCERGECRSPRGVRPSWGPLGAYIARTYTSDRHPRVERGLYRGMGVDPDADQRWPVYARSLLAFSLVSVEGLYALQRLQPVLPLSLGLPGVTPDQAFNTAASFVTNTHWQSCSGESTMGHPHPDGRAGGAELRIGCRRDGHRHRGHPGFVRARTDRVGNFWVDLVRGTLRILLPIAGATPPRWARPSSVSPSPARS
ncbi:MAG TPA: potassium-transporting ATPase subunit KdpA [Nocardioidaceae bacterium]|nr:potassium-transporting ATPase subunit KdpA [Nocardioidaceae bacterium]